NDTVTIGTGGSTFTSPTVAKLNVNQVITDYSVNSSQAGQIIDLTVDPGQTGTETYGQLIVVGADSTSQNMNQIVGSQSVAGYGGSGNINGLFGGGSSAELS